MSTAKPFLRSLNPRWLWGALVLSLVANGYQAYRLGRWRDTDLARHARRMVRVNARAELFKGLPMDSTDIILFGDSHFEHFPASELLGKPNIKNRGLSGETTADLLVRMDELVRAQAAAVVICVGSNDVSNGRSVQDYELDITRLIDRFVQESAGTKIIVLAIPPNASPETQAKVDAFNQVLIRVCHDRTLPFVDLSAALMKNGVLDPSCTYDGLHLNAKGYRILADLLRTHL